MTLEDISDGDDALLCVTNLSACCRSPNARGNWFFPNKTRVPSAGVHWDFHRTRDQMVVPLQRRRGGVNGIYRCEIPDSINVTQSIYIGVYTAGTGECRTLLFCLTLLCMQCLHVLQRNEIHVAPLSIVSKLDRLALPGKLVKNNICVLIS